MTTKLGILYFIIVTYYRDKIEKELELKSMITGSTRPPFRDTLQDKQNHIAEIVHHAQLQVEALLQHSDQYGPQTQLKLTIEKQFLRVRSVYYRVFAKLL